MSDYFLEEAQQVSEKTDDLLSVENLANYNAIEKNTSSNNKKISKETISLSITEKLKHGVDYASSILNSVNEWLKENDPLKGYALPPLTFPAAEASVWDALGKDYDFSREYNYGRDPSDGHSREGREGSDRHNSQAKKELENKIASQIQRNADGCAKEGTITVEVSDRPLPGGYYEKFHGTGRDIGRDRNGDTCSSSSNDNNIPIDFVKMRTDLGIKNFAIDKNNIIYYPMIDESYIDQVWKKYNADKNYVNIEDDVHVFKQKANSQSSVNNNLKGEKSLKESTDKIISDFTHMHKYEFKFTAWEDEYFIVRKMGVGKIVVHPNNNPAAFPTVNIPHDGDWAQIFIKDFSIEKLTNILKTLLAYNEAGVYIITGEDWVKKGRDTKITVIYKDRSYIIGHSSYYDFTRNIAYQHQMRAMAQYTFDHLDSYLKLDLGNEIEVGARKLKQAQSNLEKAYNYFKKAYEKAYALDTRTWHPFVPTVDMFIKTLEVEKSYKELQDSLALLQYEKEAEAAAKKAKQDALAKEEAEKLRQQQEAERLAKEAAEKAEAERLAKEAVDKAEAEEYKGALDLIDKELKNLNLLLENENKVRQTLLEDPFIRALKEGNVQQLGEEANTGSKNPYSNVKPSSVEDIKGKIITALGNKLGNRVLDRIMPVMGMYNLVVEHNKVAGDFVKQQKAKELIDSLEEAHINGDDDSNKRNVEQQSEPTAVSGAPDPDDNDFDTNKEGKEEFRNKGFRKNYEEKSINELKKSIKSIDKQKNLHENKINNPQSYVKDWNEKNDIERLGIVNKWGKEIKVFKEQLKILKDILSSKN